MKEIEPLGLEVANKHQNKPVDREKLMEKIINFLTNALARRARELGLEQPTKEEKAMMILELVEEPEDKKWMSIIWSCAVGVSPIYRIKTIFFHNNLLLIFNSVEIQTAWALLLKKNNLTFGDCFVYLNFFWGDGTTHEIFLEKKKWQSVGYC